MTSKKPQSYAAREEIMAKETDPLGFSETTKQALEQAHQALDTYFDFLKNESV
jgi:hypothetical protein